MIKAIATFTQVSKYYPLPWGISLWKKLSHGVSEPTKITALNQVSWSIGTGEVVGLVGPNRAGKTTLVKILLSITSPSQGHISRFDRTVDDKTTLAGVGYMHENQHFPKYLNAEKLLSFYGMLTGLDKKIIQERTPKLLELVGLADRRNEPISRFSKGMIQRLGFAQALLNDPDLLVLDEPSEGLDLPGRKMLKEQIKLRKQQNKTVLIVSHGLAELEEICDRVAVMNQGKIVAERKMKDWLLDPKSGKQQTLEQAIFPLYQTQQ